MTVLKDILCKRAIPLNQGALYYIGTRIPKPFPSMIDLRNIFNLMQLGLLDFIREAELIGFPQFIYTGLPHRGMGFDKRERTFENVV